MSLLDELQREVAQRNPLNEKRGQIEALHAQAKKAFNDQFLLDAGNKERIAFLKGRIAAFEDCLQLFTSDEEDARNKRKWGDEEEL